MTQASAKNKKAIFFDLDGTVYAGESEIPGASALIGQCLSRGIRCMYLTNRSNRTPETIFGQLRQYGIPCEVADIITTALASAEYIGSGSAYVIGEEGLEIALREKGIAITDKAPKHTIVSFDRSFTYEKLAKACDLICKGSIFIATNTDSKLKLKDTYLPGTGAIVAAVQAGTGVDPIVLGKPERMLADMALAKCGCSADEALIVGDNILTDIGTGVHAGIETVLMLTGVSSEADIPAAGITPTYVAKDYDALSRILGIG